MPRRKDPLFIPEKGDTERSRDWRLLVEKVQKCKEQGLPEHMIVNLVKTNTTIVKRILEDDKMADEAAREVFEKKIPTIKNIQMLSLGLINQTLKDMACDDELRKTMISKISDLGVLTKVISDLNTLMRLDLGQSTQNVVVHQHSYQETRELLQELKKKDPVFDYPELPEAKEPNVS